MLLVKKGVGISMSVSLSNKGKKVLFVQKMGGKLMAREREFIWPEKEANGPKGHFTHLSREAHLYYLKDCCIHCAAVMVMVWEAFLGCQETEECGLLFIKGFLFGVVLYAVLSLKEKLDLGQEGWRHDGRGFSEQDVYRVGQVHAHDVVLARGVAAALAVTAVSQAIWNTSEHSSFITISLTLHFTISV